MDHQPPLSSSVFIFFRIFVKEIKIKMNPMMNVTAAGYGITFLVLSGFIIFCIRKWKRRVTEYSNRRIFRLNSRSIGLESVPLLNRITYRIEKCMSLHPRAAKVLFPMGAAILFTVKGAVLIYFTNNIKFGDAVWISWKMVSDSLNLMSTVTEAQRIVAVYIRLCGTMLYTFLMSLVSHTISKKFDSLRDGENKVVERSHIVVLGWSTKSCALLKQLSLGNRCLGGGIVVVLAERDKEEMEMEIASLDFDFMGTNVMCRTGRPFIQADLKKVSVSKAHAIIVLASGENDEQSDQKTLSIVLSLVGMREELRCHVVVEVIDPENEQHIKHVGGDLIQIIVARNVISRLMMKCSLQRGLAKIWDEIMGVEDCGFFFKGWSRNSVTQTMRYIDALGSLPSAVPCGVQEAANAGTGSITLIPQHDYILHNDDAILLIGKDGEHVVVPKRFKKIGRTGVTCTEETGPKNILICNWGRDIDVMIGVLDELLEKGSKLWLFNDVEEDDRERILNDAGILTSDLVNIELVYEVRNAAWRLHLESLPFDTFHSIIILAEYSLEGSVADSRSIETLIVIEELMSKHQGNHPIILTEIVDCNSRNLVSSCQNLDWVSSEFVFPNELVSMALARVAEDRRLYGIIGQLFAYEGYEICIKPANYYCLPDDRRDFRTIMARAHKRSEIMIGYLPSNSAQAIINPTDKHVRKLWSDSFVVISRREASN